MIKMFISTYYNGKRYEKGKYYFVDNYTEARWIKNKIAAKEQESEERFAEMSDEELRKYADEQSVKIPGNVTKRETIIDIILKHKQNNGG